MQTHFTFGIELEFLFLVDERLNADPTYDHYLKVSEHDNPGQSDPIFYKPSSFPLLEQCVRLLRRNDLKVRACPMAKDSSRPDMWHVTHESMVDEAAIGCDDAKLRRWSNNRLQTVKGFNAIGLELVSRVLSLPNDGSPGQVDDGLEEIRSFLEALRPRKGDPFNILSHAEIGGFHVHVGVPEIGGEPESGLEHCQVSKNGQRRHPIDLKVLQHLAYILTEYEDIISSFHHPQRRGWYGTKTWSIAESNRFSFQRHEHTCGKFGLPDQTEMQEKIFDKDIEYQTLAQLMGQHNTYDFSDRNRFVNWENIYKTSRPPTIEFRQHHGTMEFEDIKHWILFITALLRAAERKANQAPGHGAYLASNPAFQEGSKYPRRPRHETQRIFDLFQLLRLEPAQVKYWLGRRRAYASEEFVVESWYGYCMACENDKSEV